MNLLVKQRGIEPLTSALRTPPRRPFSFGRLCTELHRFYVAAVRREVPAAGGDFLLHRFVCLWIRSSQIRVKTENVGYVFTTSIRRLKRYLQVVDVPGQKRVFCKGVKKPRHDLQPRRGGNVRHRRRPDADLLRKRVISS